MSNGGRCEKHDNWHAHCRRCCAENTDRLAARVRELEEALRHVVEWSVAARASDAIGQTIWLEVIEDARAALAATEEKNNHAK